MCVANCERYGHAMHFLKGIIFKRWLGLVVQRNMSPEKLLTPVAMQQQDAEQRAPKRMHESPAMPVRAPRSPGGATYALALTGQSSSSTESTPSARPAKTRSKASSSASERSGQG